MKRCLDEQAVDHFENEFFYPDGSSGWFELSIQPVPEGIFILSVDITARKKAEEHIQYQAGLLQNVSDAIISTDADNYIRMWNPAAEKTYGWKAEEVLGKKFRSIIQPNYKYRPREEVFAQIEDIGTWTGEIIHHHRDGHPISILSTISLLRDAAGHVSGMVSVNHDITAQKVAEEKIRQSEAQLRSVWENAQEGMRLTDAEGTVIRVNAAYCKIMNMTREEIEGKPLAVVYAPDRFEHIIKTHQERFKNRSVKPKSEEEVTLRDGRKIWIEVSNSYFEIDNEKPLLLGIFRDITERKKTEEALNRSQEQLRQTQKLEALGQLASGIAHDFNNMLAIILGNTYIMKSNLNDQGKMTRSLDIIESTGQRGANLVKQLLTLARRNEPSITQVNLNELINDTVKMLSETFPKNITFETDIKLTLPYILADVSQIHQCS
jgi:PAS domain S-box-containing protein